MANEKDRKESKVSELMQAYLKVDCMGSGNPPRIVLRKASEESHLADLVMLPGVVVDVEGASPDFANWSEHDSWAICSKVVERLMISEKMGKECPDGNACCEHLAHAYSILCDYANEFDGVRAMSKETAETLVRGAIERIVRAGKCFGLRLDRHMIDD